MCGHGGDFSRYPLLAIPQRYSFYFIYAPFSGDKSGAGGTHGLRAAPRPHSSYDNFLPIDNVQAFGLMLRLAQKNTSPSRQHA